MRDLKTEAVASIIREKRNSEPAKVLVVGCGSGIEAAVLSDCLGADVVGIDVVENFDEGAQGKVTLRRGDAMSLDYSDESFDFVYSYHALEHIDDPQKALSEIYRVLKRGGACWIGTPNRLRVIGYVGSVGVSLRDKIAWNLADWRARLSGKFRNEFGAHAGFSSTELRKLMEDCFPAVDEMTKRYFMAIYTRHEVLLNIVNFFGLSKVLYPSVYFYGEKL